MLFQRPARALAALLLVPLAAVGASSVTAADAGAARTTTHRATTNPTGTNAGSLENGVGNLHVSLTMLPNGQIRVDWVPPFSNKKKKLLKFIVKVAANKRMDDHLRQTTVGPKKTTLTVPPAYGAGPYSGNYTFVKVTYVRTHSPRSDSPAKWIQAPIVATCTASLANQLTVATFNVHTWTGDPQTGLTSWNSRRQHVIDQILAGGARVVAIQEASGRADVGFGSLRQIDWILAHLNATDTSPGHDWRDAVADDTAYIRPGLVGTRIVYDASKYHVINWGVLNTSGSATGTINPARIPWAQMQDVGATAPAFVFASIHLQTGETSSAYQIRAKQMSAIIPFLKDKQATYGGQLIAAGDFNSTVDTKPDNGAQAAMIGAGFYDSFASPSIANAKMPSTNSYIFPVVPSPHRRDYIMSLGPVKGSCSHTNFAYRLASDGVASDHFMQVATLPLSTS